jgi:DnaK suppressor protein
MEACHMSQRNTMDAITAQKYKHRLVVERDALLAQIDAQRGGPISRADAASEALDKSEDDNAQIQTGRDIAFAINEHETAELLAIDASLLRIKEGVYGLCVDCGTHIPAARMDAAPHTLRCLACQTTFEQAHPV